AERHAISDSNYANEPLGDSGRQKKGASALSRRPLSQEVRAGFRPCAIDLTTPARAPCARRLLLRGGADIARSVPTMHCIENPKLRRPRGVEDLQHMRNAAIRFFLWPTPAAK